MTALEKKAFISSDPITVLSSCPPPCGHFSIQESAAGGLSYKVKKLYVCRIQAHSLKAYEFPGYARSYLSQTMTRSLKNTFESSRSSGSGIITPGSLPNFSVTYLPGIHPYSNGIAQDFHLFPF